MTSPLDPIRSRLAIGRDRAARLRRRPSVGVFARLTALEAEVQENRQLNRRIAELLLPVADRDEERVRQTLADYRVRL
jgi:hypothetical protein